MTVDPWPAPQAAGPVTATVRMPGSKSMTNRALVLASLASAPSRLHHPLHSRDTTLMAAALRRLGATVDDTGATGDHAQWTVTPGTAPLSEPVRVDVGNAGTVLRFVPPLAARAGVPVSFDGDPAARRRPVGPLLHALRELGVSVDDDGRGTLPFVVTGKAQLPGGRVDIDASTSSQLVSALLLAGPTFTDGVTVRHVGDRPVPNAPHLAMTVSMLRARGIEATASEREWSVASGTVAAVDEVVEPDLSSAAPFLAAAAVTGGRIRIPGWPQQSTQPGALLPELLTAFGAHCTLDDSGLTVIGPDAIAGAELDLRDAGELAPVLAAIAALADSPSRLVGIDYLRGHETDRLAALAREIARLGGAVDELADGLAITPKPLHGGRFETYDDHRLVMAAAVIALVVPGVLVANAATVGKTFPEFTDVWEEAVH